MAEPETKKTKVAEGAGSAEGAPTKKAIITGITGQDGSYLAEFLLEKVLLLLLLLHRLFRMCLPVIRCIIHFRKRNGKGTAAAAVLYCLSCARPRA